MNMRDLKPHTLKRLAVEGDAEFDEWFKRTGGKEFGKGDQPMSPREIWRYAYSRALTNCLKRVDLGNFKDV